MKLLHTSDWHVGKSIRGHNRADEHRDVLAEIVSVAAEEAVDLIVVAGDLYETAAPSAEAEAIVNQSLLDLADVAPVVAVSGNHDNPRRLAAVAPLLKLGRITMATAPRAPDDGGVATFDLGGIEVDVALVPFVSQRGIVRAQELMANAGFQNAQTYADRMRRVLDSLCADFRPDRVNLVVAHAFVHGGDAGGGERQAHLVDEYGLSSVDFPPSAAYVALGHLHRPQQMLGPTAIHYCGSPIQLDFSEGQQAKQVNLVNLEPGLPAKVEARVLQTPRPLRTLRGTLADVEAQVDNLGSHGLAEGWFRVRLDEPSRAGLAEEVRLLIGPNVVDVRVDRSTDRPTVRRFSGERSPRALFADYLESRAVEDPAVELRFAQLHDQLLDGPSQEDDR